MNLPTFLRFEYASFHSKVARRIFLLFILCALIPLCVLAYFAFHQVTKSLYSQASDELFQSSKNFGMMAIERLQFLESDLEMLRPLFRKELGNLHVHTVPGLQERFAKKFKSLMVSTKNGAASGLFGTISAIPRLSKDEQDHLDSGKALILTRLTPAKHVGVYLVKTIDRQQPRGAFFFGEIRPEYLWGEDGFSNPMTELIVLDESSRVLFASFSGYVPLDEIRNALQNKNAPGSFTWVSGNDSYLAHSWNAFMLPQFHANWIVVQSRLKTDILAPVGNFKKIFLLLVLLTFFIVLLLSLIQVRRSLVPIKLLHEVTQQITAKKFESRVTIRTNDEFEELGRAFNEMASSLEDYLQTMSILRHIGLALSAEKNNHHLLEIILDGAKKITNADGCVLYTVTKDKQLRRTITHIDSLNLTIGRADDMMIPLYDAEGMPNTATAITFSAHNGSVVNIPDVYRAKNFDFACEVESDRTLGYKTRSFLSVPIKDHENEIVGVLQLTNAQDRLSRKIVSFSDKDRHLLEALASQAAVAFSKNRLIDDFKALFDSLVELIATAIDKKSPYTGDHCRRVPELTMMLAEAVFHNSDGVFKNSSLSEDELYELKIAALLHDCGKVTTPVHIADKATRLETIADLIHIIEARFEIVKRDVQIAFLQKTTNGVCRKSKNVPQKEQEAFIKILSQIDEDRLFVRTCNSGSIMMDENRKARIHNIAHAYRWVNADGIEKPILSETELYMLTSATVGTLTPKEREVLNQHVETTTSMLESLHYPKALRNVPLFAQVHHERMDGKGYPKGLTQKEIPLQGRIIALADIFEAMTARNRPYKKGMSLMNALRTLGSLKQEGHIDPDLFDVFIDEKVYLRYAEKYLSPSQMDEVVLTQIPGYTPPS